MMTGINTGQSQMIAKSILESVVEIEVAVSNIEWSSWMTMLPGSKLPLEWLFLNVSLPDVFPIGEEKGDAKVIRLLGFREAVRRAAMHLETLRQNCLFLPW